MAEIEFVSNDETLDLRSGLSRKWKAMLFNNQNNDLHHVYIQYIPKYIRLLTL